MSIAVPVIDYKALVQDDRIHVSLYTDPRIFADEMDRIFTRGWVFVGHASEIPRSGDYVTRELGTQPVIMVRGKDGGVSVLVNRCMHRGTMLCTAGRGATRTFACPYHGWTYDLDGTLLGVPYRGGYAEFDKSAHGLRHAARVASYRGFVFASFSPTGPSLAEHLGRATKLIDRSCDLSPEGEIELSAGWVKHRCAANWKALPENDSDGYHGLEEREVDEAQVVAVFFFPRRRLPMSCEWVWGSYGCYFDLALGRQIAGAVDQFRG